MPEQLKTPQPEKIIKQCQQLIQKGQLNQAAENLNNMLTEHPGHIEGVYCLAVCQRKQQKYNESMANLNQVLSARFPSTQELIKNKVIFIKP